MSMNIRHAIRRMISTSSSTGSSRWDKSGRWEKATSSAVQSKGNKSPVSAGSGIVYNTFSDTHSNAASLTGGSKVGESFLLKEKFGEYFKVPNPATVMTKIVCTIGPATCEVPALTRMIGAGMSAARINCAHGDHEWFLKIIKNVRAAAESKNKICPIILDIKGPEIRVCSLPKDGTKKLESGNIFILVSGETVQARNYIADEEGNKISVTYPNLARSVEEGDVILLDDGRISLIVRGVKLSEIKSIPSEVICEVIVGGVLKSNKGVNLPGIAVTDLPHLTEKDKRDVAFAVENKVEFIAHSFTRSKDAILQVRELPGVIENGTHIIAKIESQEGLDNFNGILQSADSIMVARGDLGVEIPLERVCSVQKRLVNLCNSAGKPVIVATELLDSMVKSPRPTRAEASDVANAVFDGADCVMLSGETAVGDFPVEAIQVMTRICKEAEIDIETSLKERISTSNLPASQLLLPVSSHQNNSYEAIADAFSASAVHTARSINARLILLITRSATPARSLAKHYSGVPIMVLSTSPKVCAQVSLNRSVTPYLVHSLERESCVPRALLKAIDLGIVEQGERVVLLTGHDDKHLNRLESFVVGEKIPDLKLIPGQRYKPGSSIHMV